MRKPRSRPSTTRPAPKAGAGVPPAREGVGDKIARPVPNRSPAERAHVTEHDWLDLVLVCSPRAWRGRGTLDHETPQDVMVTATKEKENA